jgi:pimeloyl-ACP methyl ester carboxylesterase
MAADAPAPPRLEEWREVGPGAFEGKLVAAGEHVRFQLRRPQPAQNGESLVLLVPILAGGEDLMDQVAQRLVARGFAVAFCARVAPALKPPQRGPDLDLLFHRTVLHQRLLLAFLRHREDRPAATFVLGISMGGMVSTVVSALEPVDGVAICLSGADLADLVRHSSEARVQRWRAWRLATDGVGDDHIAWELQRYLRYEPLAFAPSIATEKVLFVSCDRDSVVPPRNQDLLWEALGRPARLRIGLGHYSAALAIDSILGAAADHFAARRASRLD